MDLLELGLSSFNSLLFKSRVAVFLVVLGVNAQTC